MSDTALIIKHTTPGDEKYQASRVRRHAASLADLRKALEKDGVIGRDDRFQDPEEFIIEKSSEAKVKLTDTKKVSRFCGLS